MMAPVARNFDTGVVWGLYMSAVVVASVSTLLAVIFSLTTLAASLTSHIDPSAVPVE
jgi:hypothetical protein